MCGIAGFVSKDKDKEKNITNMLNRIIHRGPDGEGKYIDEDIALWHRRLSIIDLESGAQPMFNEDKSLVIKQQVTQKYYYMDIKNIKKK